MRAEIRRDGFDEKESEKLKPFLEIAGHFAKRWKRIVYLDAPHGKTAPHSTGDSDLAVYIHFFSAPTYQYDSQEAHSYKKTTKALFYFDLPAKNLKVHNGEGYYYIEGEDVALFLGSKQGYRGILSPESQSCAQTVSNHVYILFDLAHRPWVGDKLVFWEILERSAENLFENGAPSKNEAGEESSFDWMELKNGVLRQKNRLYKRFCLASKLLLNREEVSARKILESSREEMLKLEEEILNVRLRIETQEQLLKQTEAGSKDYKKRVKKEFELIHKFKGVRGIKVEGDLLTVFTSPVEHAYKFMGALSTDVGETVKKTLSEYIITIRCDSLESNATYRSVIFIAEHGWKSEFMHPERIDANLADRCFGTGKLKTSVEKAISDRDVPAIVFFCLHYLDSDNRPASPRNINLGKETKQKPEKEYEAKPFYENSGAKEAALWAYTRLIENNCLNPQKNRIKAAIAELQKQKNEITQKLKETRDLVFMMSQKTRFLQDYSERLPLRREFETAFNIKELVFMRIGSDFIWLIFSPGRGRGDYGKARFDEHVRILIKIETGSVYILNKPSAKEFAYVRDAADFRSGDEAHVVCEEYLSGYLIAGKLGTAISVIFGWLRGIKIPKTAKQKNAVFKKKEILAFLKRELPQVGGSK